MHSHPLAFNMQLHLACDTRAVRRADRARRRFWPHCWRAVVITALFQTTMNFGSDDDGRSQLGGAGRTSVLVYHDAVLDDPDRMAPWRSCQRLSTQDGCQPGLVGGSPFRRHPRWD